MHVVERGETLYAVALDYGLDYRELSAWNGLADPAVIQPGQQLRLKPPPGWKPEDTVNAGSAANEVIARPIGEDAAVEAKPLDPPPAVKTAPKAIKLAWSESALARLRAELGLPPLPAPQNASKPPASAVDAKPPRQVSPSTTAVAVAPSGASKPAGAAAPAASLPPATARVTTPSSSGALSWAWPVRGKLLHGFNEGPNPKGVAIAGEPGQPVFASAAGKVVYSGSGLRGYGKLVIIKHTDTYLSVYAHNRELLVKEGDRVARGQRIASMGDTDSDRVALHFEIRRFGTPVDPLSFLPQGGG